MYFTSSCSPRRRATVHIVCPQKRRYNFEDSDRDIRCQLSVAARIRVSATSSESRTR
jgi:hypothetical protein